MTASLSHLVITTALAFGIACEGASANPEDAAPTHDGEQTNLFLVADESCQEDYAAELKLTGIFVAPRSVKSLEYLGRFVGVPKGASVTHLFIVGGYVVANHVAPIAVANLLTQKPKIAGLIGPTTCPTSENHQQIHAETPSAF